MSGITYREIRFEKKEQGGRVRFRRFCWNSVNMGGLGGGWEPQALEHQCSNTRLNEDFYPSSMGRRVDKIALDASYSNPFTYDVDKQGNKAIRLTGGNLVQDYKISLDAR